MNTENINEMNVKIQNKSPHESGGDNKSGCGGMVNYLRHEDSERESTGKEILPFTTAEGIPVSWQEVIEKIDRNHSHLSAKDDKFYHLVVSPSPDEILAMGADDGEVYKNSKKLIKAISDAYAQNFNREGIEDADDILIYWKPHFTRGDNGELQFHLHAIISRNSKGIGGKVMKISPMTPHRNTENGPVKGGFDKKLFFERCEKLFDQLFHFERKVAESFAYRNAQKHGTPEEKAEQAKALATEKKPLISEAIKTGLENRRKTVQNLNEVNEIAAMLNADNIEIPHSENNSLELAINIAGQKSNILRLFAESQDKFSLDLGLAQFSLSCKPVLSKNGGVSDLAFIKSGRTFRASDIMEPSQLNSVLACWEVFTGQQPAFKIAEREARRLAEKATEEAALEQHKLTIRHHF